MLTIYFSFDNININGSIVLGSFTNKKLQGTIYVKVASKI